MYILKLKHHFSSAHRLENYDGACANLHGHDWKVEVEIQNHTLVSDMVVDFKVLKKLIDNLDHCFINDKVDFNPTAENIAKYFYDEINKIALFDQVVVTIWESDGASITYSI
jgi:6-pyruvoyltetrahydropterin/6-carboxytetrahydropterin synthase